MPRYEIEVVESRAYKRTYTVEADSPEEASEQAERGDTVDESEGTLTDIINREVTSTPKLIH